MISFSSLSIAPPLMYTITPTTSIQSEGGTSTSFECVTDGFPKPNIIWLFNNSLITVRADSLFHQLKTCFVNFRIKDSLPLLN